MKYFLTVLLFMFTFYTKAQVSTGDVIKAKDLNGSSHHLGSIQQSLLTEAEFQSVAGDCWVKMRGQSIASSDLANLTSNRLSVLPDSSGRFLRDIDGNAPSLAQTQEDAIRNISGTYYSHGNSNKDSGRATTATGAFSEGSVQANGLRSSALAGTLSAPMNFDASNVVPTANENRPVNLGVNIFIKINKECN